jgi:hypothetical protein
MTEAADQSHAVHLARLLFKAADQQHVAIGFEVLFLAELRNLGGRRFDCGLSHIGLALPRVNTLDLVVEFRSRNSLKHIAAKAATRRGNAQRTAWPPVFVAGKFLSLSAGV